MVWKRSLIVIVLSLAVMVAMPLTASAAEPYTEGNISTTYITIYRDIAAKLSPFDDYVMFRSDQYEYQMWVGDLDESDGVISSASDLLVYTISTNSSSGYSSAYIYTVTTGSALSLTVGDNLVYSNLGNYPDLIERSGYYETATLLLLLVALCLFILRSVFGWCYRTRR